MDLLSEDEQWDALKRWVRTNGPSVVVMVALALLAWFGWRWWQDRQNRQALEAGAIYTQVLADFDAGKLDIGLAGIEKLRSDYPGSAYVAVADLAAANMFVANNDLEKAVIYLDRVTNSAKDKLLRPIARLRLARVQAAQAQYDKALATLGTADMGAHQSAYLEARGDVLFAKGDRAAALKEYEASRALLSPESAGPEGVGMVLDLKISDLKATEK
ncbi:MAG: tetratricopeptide repeat protein [Steroidobacteraceae bacterium]